jgi:3'(2'), 5'-bisphosphate nucleotidase
LAQIRDGKVIVAALGCPELDDAHRPYGKETAEKGPGSLLVATLGGGTWAAPLDESSVDNPSAFRRLSVSKIDDPRQARLMRSVEKAHTDMGGVGALSAELGTEAPAVPMDSQAKYSVLASGHGEMLVRLLSPSRPDYREKIWDQAAGSLIIEEAGGRVSDLDGKPLDFSAGRTLANNRGVLATNGRLHKVALAALGRISA